MRNLSGPARRPQVLQVRQGNLPERERTRRPRHRLQGVTADHPEGGDHLRDCLPDPGCYNLSGCSTHVSSVLHFLSLRQGCGDGRIDDHRQRPWNRAGSAEDPVSAFRSGRQDPVPRDRQHRPRAGNRLVDRRRASRSGECRVDSGRDDVPRSDTAIEPSGTATVTHQRLRTSAVTQLIWTQICQEGSRRRTSRTVVVDVRLGGPG